MKNFNLRIVLSAVCMLSIMAAFVKVEAGPIRFDQVVQIMNARPGKAEASSFTRIRVANYYDGIIVGSDDGEDNKKNGGQKQDGRVITETKTDIVTDEVCDCVEDVETGGRFPKWALLGLAAIPIAFILIKRKKDTPTPTPRTPTPTPPFTPTPTPTPKTPTPTPPITPTPTPPEPVPEPITILLFGTGLASIGFAARRKFGKKGKSEGDDEK